MAVMRIAVTLGYLLIAHSAQATNLTDIIGADQGLKNGLLNKNPPPPSPAGPFIPAPVSVQVSATQAPTPTQPPQTNPPSTPPTPTTTAAPSTTPAPLPTSCTGLPAGAACFAAQPAKPQAVVGGRCTNGACVGTTITLCAGTTKPATCTVGANAGKVPSYCDPLTPGDAAQLGVPATQEAAEYGNPATPPVNCNTSFDCPLGQWCDGYTGYAGTGHVGECIGQC